MEFAVASGDALALHAGEKIRGTLYPTKTGPYRLEQIWPDDRVSEQAVAAGAHVLREDTHDRGKNVYREVGEKAPDFVLYDQDGNVVQAARFRGKQIMLNFIYTRCPVAQYVSRLHLENDGGAKTRSSRWHKRCAIFVGDS